MLGVTGGRRPVTSRPPPPGFLAKLDAAWSTILEQCTAAAGGNPLGVTRDMFIGAVRQVLTDLTPAEDDFVRQVSLDVTHQLRGHNVTLPDLDYLRCSLLQGRVPPQELDPPPPTLSRSTFTTATSNGVKSLDLTKTTGVNWKVPPGFLTRYNAVSPQVRGLNQIMRLATSLVGARHDGAREVVQGLWGRVDVGTFVEACRQLVEGGLSAAEEEYVAALAVEQVPAGSTYIRDLPFLDKCLQQGRLPASIKGPTLLPTVFLNNNTSDLGDNMALKHTGGRIY